MRNSINKIEKYLLTVNGTGQMMSIVSQLAAIETFKNQHFMKETDIGFVEETSAAG